MPKWDPDSTLPGLVAENPDLRSDDVLTLFPDANAEQIGRAIRRIINPDPKGTPALVRADLSDLEDLERRALKALQKAKKSNEVLDILHLSDVLDRGSKVVREVIASLQEKGFMVEASEFEFKMADPKPTGYTPIPVSHFRSGKWFKFGGISDTHLASKYERLDVLNAAYDCFESEGIHQVLHCGNWVEGEARFNRMELLTPAGYEAQVAYFLKHYPQKKGIKTSFIDGSDHEGWWAHSMGLVPGKRMVQSAHDMGRHDLEYLGYHEVDLPFYAEEGDKPAIVRLVHPGGGSSYADSYKPQKMVESYQGGEKPSVLLIGHFHKSGVFENRNIHIVQMGCTQDQSLFMRKKQLRAELGFYIIEMLVDNDGSVKRFRTEWNGFYDRGYYQNKYAMDSDAVRIVA